MQGQAALFPLCAALASAVSFIGFLLKHAGVGGLTSNILHFDLFITPHGLWACTCKSCAHATAWAAFFRRIS